MLTTARTAGLAGEALILNDTARQYHFGCFATSLALHNLLLDDGYSVATLPVTLTHGLALPPTLAGLDPGAMRDAVHAAAPAVAAALDQADLVVVNGEGTLHGLNGAPRNLLGLMQAAKVAFGKRTYLVNHSLFPADKAERLEGEHVAVYRPALEGLDGIAAREPLSVGNHAALGRAATASFDLLPAFAERIGALQPAEPRDPDLVLAGVGVNWPADRLRGFAETVRRSVPPSKRIVFLDGGPRREPLQERLFAELIDAGGAGIARAAIVGDRALPDGVRARAWLRLIARAGLIVTGRYHHVVAAFAFGTPVVALSSNVPKIEGTYRLLGFDQPVVDPDGADWTEALARAIGQALEGGAAATMPGERQALRALAQKNALWRPAAAHPLLRDGDMAAAGPGAMPARAIGKAAYERSFGLSYVLEEDLPSLAAPSLHLRVIPAAGRYGLRPDMAGRRVALVGNKPILGCGARIDGHDEVIRISSMRAWRRDPADDGVRLTSWAGSPAFVVDPHPETGAPQAQALFAEVAGGGTPLWGVSPFHVSLAALRWMEEAGAIGRFRVAPPPLALFDAFCARLEPDDLATLFAIAPPRHNLVGLPRIERLLTGTRILLLLELSGVTEIGLFGTDLFVDTADPLWFGHDPAVDLAVIEALGRRLVARGGTFFWNEESAVVAALGQRRVAGGG